MWKGKHPAIFLEGLDGVGKNDLLRSIVRYVTLADPERKILVMNFPQYWFFGHDIRLVLRGAVDDILKGYKGIDNIRFRSYLYGMDRALAVMLVETYLQKNPDAFVISDRGPYSSCVTTGYVWSSGDVTEEQISTQIVPDVFLSADAAMFNFFDGKSLLVQIVGNMNDSELGVRKSLDNYEVPTVQEYGGYVYDMLGLSEISTKHKGKWFNRMELAMEALRKTGNSSIATRKIDKEMFESEYLLYNRYKEGKIVLVGPDLLLSSTNGDKYISKSTRKDIEKWNRLSLTSGVNYRKPRKEGLDLLETKIAKGIKNKAEKLDVSTFKNSFAKQYLAKSFIEYPFMYDVLRRTSGKAMISFFEKLLASDQFTLF